MLTQLRVLSALGFVLAAGRGFADIASIHAAALPQETAVLASLDDVRRLEPYSPLWQPEWNFAQTKDEVTARLGKDLGFLRAASIAHPDNAELLLLTGVVADFANNLDVEHSYETALDVFQKAEKIAPADVRPAWFRSRLQCESSQRAEDGANGFLAIESNHPWDTLPIAFWDDYLECAMESNMSAHGLRAANYLKKLQAPPSERRDALAAMAAKHFIPVDMGTNTACRSPGPAVNMGTIWTLPVLPAVFACAFTWIGVSS